MPALPITDTMVEQIGFAFRNAIINSLLVNGPEHISPNYELGLQPGDISVTFIQDTRDPEALMQIPGAREGGNHAEWMSDILSEQESSSALSIMGIGEHNVFFVQVDTEHLSEEEVGVITSMVYWLLTPMGFPITYFNEGTQLSIVAGDSPGLRNFGQEHGSWEMAIDFPEEREGSFTQRAGDSGNEATSTFFSPFPQSQGFGRG